MGRAQQRTCRHCAERFIADARNAHHQRYCSAPACKAASKRASQAKWLAKPENRDYHRGPEAVARVQAWRRAHPGYSRRAVGVRDSERGFGSAREGPGGGDPIGLRVDR